MFSSPDQEWRRLTALYAEKYDEELWQLAADYKDLTEMAQQVLRDEMKKRGLGDPTASRPVQPDIDMPGKTIRAEAPREPRPAVPVDPREQLRLAGHYATIGEDDLRELAADLENLTPAAQQALREEMLRRGMDDLQTDEEVESGTLEGRESNPYFQVADLRAQKAPESNAWWVRVGDIDNREQARQRVMMLSDAGIEARAHLSPFGGYAIEVAADQADEANAVLAQPVPQKIVDESKIEVPEFQMPKCPRCKAEEAVLQSAEGGNHWRCDACGHEWDEALVEPGNA